MLSNGTAINMFTRQRPQLIFEADGVTPRAMVVGGSFSEYNNGNLSLGERTFVFEFNGV
jgi:hypothetical protein